MYVDRNCCNGCGECRDICPEGAISLWDGLAFIDEKLCQESAMCQSAYPQNAIVSSEVVVPVMIDGALPVVVKPPDSAITPHGNMAPSLREIVLPVISSTLLWTGREVIPRLARLVLDSLDKYIQSDRKPTRTRKTRPQTGLISKRGYGQRRRLRNRNRRIL